VKKIGRWILWLGLLGLVIGAGVLALMPQPVSVEWGTVEPGPMRVAIEEDGMTRIKERYVVSSNVGGNLLRIDLRAGDTIEQGKTLLATIQPSDPSMLDARQLTQAEASVEAAKLSVERADARRNLAKAAADLAESQFARISKLFEAKAIPRDEYDTAVTIHRSRQDEMRVANFETKIAEFELKQAEAAVEHFSSVGSNPDGLSRIEIRAPIDGRVLRVMQESATVLTPGTPLIEVGNPGDLEVVIDVLSSDAVKISIGDEVELVEWGGERPLQGRVRVVEPAAFTKVSALGVEEQRVNVVVDFQEATEVISRLGDSYRVEARIFIWSAEQVLRIPTSALFREEGVWKAFRIVDNRAELITLEIGKRNAEVAEVLKGVEAGARVVVYPNDMVKSGVELAPKERPVTPRE
jgi:HlyD family secretion protein